MTTAAATVWVLIVTTWVPLGQVAERPAAGVGDAARVGGGDDGGAAADVDDAARLVSAQTQVILQVHGVAQWRHQLQALQISRLMADAVISSALERSWQRLLDMLQLDSDEAVDRYLGRHFAAIWMAGQQSEGMPVLLSRVEPEHGRALVERTNLMAARSGWSVEGFDFYRTPERGGARVGVSPQWLLLAFPRERGAMTQLLARTQGPRLAEDPTYQQWMAMLPSSPVARLYVRLGEGRVHVAGAGWEGQTLVVRYRGQSPTLGPWLARWDPAEARALPPLASGVFAAVKLRAVDHDPTHYETAGLDRLLAPQTFARDVLPRLAAPLVLFAAASDRGDPDGGKPLLPTLGLCFRLLDRELARDLTLWLSRGLVAWSLGSGPDSPQPQRQPGAKLAVATHTHEAGDYAVANLGAVLVSRGADPALQAMQLVFGRIGDWYLLTTDGGYFGRCQEVATRHAQGWVCPTPTGMDGPVAQQDGGGRGRMTLASLAVDGPVFVRYVQVWMDHMQARAVRPQAALPAERVLQAVQHDQMVRTSTSLCELFRSSHHLSMHLFADNRDRLEAELRLTTQPAADR